MTASQIVALLKEVEAGVPVAEVVRKAGVSKATFFTWRSKYGGATVRELARLKKLEAENTRLKRIYAELALENAAIMDGGAFGNAWISNDWMAPSGITNACILLAVRPDAGEPQRTS